MADAFEIQDARAEIGLRIRDGAELQHHGRLEVADVLIQVFGKVAFDRRLQTFGGVGRKGDGHTSVITS